VRPRIIYRRTYFVIRTEIYAPPASIPLRSLSRRQPHLENGFRIESDELLLRRYSCISMTHRFTRDLSFNGVALFLSPCRPFCRFYGVLAGQYRGGDITVLLGAEESQEARCEISDTWTTWFRNYCLMFDDEHENPTYTLFYTILIFVCLR